VAGLTAEQLLAGWLRAGVEPGMHVIVHASLSSMGPVRGGASAVVESLLAAVGEDGTIVAPAFTPHVRDPHPEVRGVPDADVAARRAAVPPFTPDTPSTMGAVAEAVRTHPGARRSRHPQASFSALGAHAEHILAPHPLGFAFGPGSPFDRLSALDGRILLIGVAHDRNSFLHHAETLTAHRRLALRRFPLLLDGERVWCETLDVDHDNGTYFPVVGRAYEHAAGIEAVRVGDARVVLLAARPFIEFAVARLDSLLAAAQR
jgi:aminoglycoside 3-N-acetyltransferase